MQHTSGRSTRRRSNRANRYSDTEESDVEFLFDRRANRSFPEDRHRDDAFPDDIRANTTFPPDRHNPAFLHPRRGPRDLRRTNAFHSGVPRTIRGFDRTDGNISSQESPQSDERPVQRGGLSRWVEGRSVDRTTERPRESRRFHPYERDEGTSRSGSQPLLDRGGYDHHSSRSRNGRRSSNSTEEGDEIFNDRRPTAPPTAPVAPTPPKPAPALAPNDPQAIHAMFQLYFKSLPERERKAFWDNISPGQEQPGLQHELVSIAPVKPDGPEVVGLLPLPSVQHLDDGNDSMDQ